MVVLILVLGTFLVFLTPDRKKQLAIEAESMSETATNPYANISFVKGDRIDKEKLKQVANLSYEEIKQEFGVQNEFCMYIVDQDGNLIPITLDDNRSLVGIGRGEARINGIPCGENITS